MLPTLCSSVPHGRKPRQVLTITEKFSIIESVRCGRPGHLCELWGWMCTEPHKKHSGYTREIDPFHVNKDE